MPPRPEAHHSNDSTRVSDSQHPNAAANASRILQEMTPADIRASAARQREHLRISERNCDLPGFMVCHDPTDFTDHVQLAPYDLDHNGSISREELQQTENNRGADPVTRATAFGLLDNFDQVARGHDDWFNGDITQDDLNFLHLSPSDAPLVESINGEISFISGHY